MNDTPPPSHEAPRHVAGVGASAGGLEALERLFARMPTDTGIAFVVVQHLAPDFESMMDELLARKTKLPVQRVTDGMRLCPDQVYVIPPGKEMIVSSGRLLLADKPREAQVSSLIDLFFRSLARDAGERAIGIVLSGGGTDGAAGVRAIHEAGGLVIVQSPGTAGVDGMPTSAVSTGIADLVLSPEEMPDSLVRYARELGPASPDAARPPTQKPLETVLALVRERVGVDFSHYKSNTVLRRIHRRLMFHPARRMEDFVARLASDPDELDALYNDLLIGVTRFFRDGDAWSTLGEQALPVLIRELEAGAELRAWVAGCATGEEAYSLALLLRELIEAHDREDITVKIFATDVHPEALEIANRGLYSTESLERLSSARRERWFTRHGEIWRVAPEIRQMIVFARHDVTSDPPFTRLHFVSCRNLLIYLKTESQRKVISLFHFSLRPGGYLFLGSSETTHGADEGFETVDRGHKLYRRRRDLRLPAAFSVPLARGGSDDGSSSNGGSKPSVGRMLGIYDLLLEQYMPPGLLVDEKLNLLHTFGGAGRLLRVKDGRPSRSVLDMVAPEVRMPLTGALNRCLKERTEVAWTSAPTGSEEDRSRVVVKPLTGRNVEPTCLLVSFDTVSPPSSTDSNRREVQIDDISQEQLESLEHELQHTRESLHATIEELETSNEELQSTNEELLASNEELQSTNEELQSVNEELYTVNAELQDKIAQLTELANDMDNLFAATDVGTIFLDQKLCIRKFTPAIAELFHLLPRDVGRSIASFTHRIDDPRILDDVQRVLEQRTKIEREVQDLDGNWLFLRILPYHADGAAAGVVVTLVDISSLKRAEDELFRERYLLRSLMELVPDPITFKDAEGRFVRVNSAFAAGIGLPSAQQAVGKRLSDLRPGEASSRTEAKEKRIVQTEEAVLDDLEDAVDETGRRRWHLTSTLPLHDENGRAVGTLGISRDISGQKRAENEAHAAVRRRDRFLATLSHELRNPLAAISSASEVAVRQSTLPDEVARPLTVIHRQSEHMARMLDDLLDVARVMQDDVPLRRTPVDLVKIARGCIEAVEMRLEDRSVEVIADFPDEPVGVEGDRHRLQQCIDNLLSNAIHHSSADARIWIRIERRDDEAELTIRDEGAGIEPELLDAIFEPFVQADQSLDRPSSGMGLGLALVKKIVAKHGGRVTGHSEGLGKGASFVMTIPCCAVDSQAKEPSDEQDLRGLRVVVVEDERDNREMLTTILELNGCTVYGAGDGLEGFQLIRRMRPHVALIDLGLPKLDGFEVAGRVRRELGQEVHLVAVSGYGQPSDRQRARKSGFDTHVVKPVRTDALVQILARVARPRTLAPTS